jgi:hypothetical protein
MLPRPLYKILEPFLSLHTDFLKLFFVNEYQALAGSSNKRIAALFGILLLTLCALAFAVGSVDYLKQRMDNPFTNWVDMPVIRSFEDQVPAIKKHFSTTDNLSAFGLKSLTEYTRFSPLFYNAENSETYYTKGMTFNPNGELIQKILQDTPRGESLFSDEGVLKEEYYGGIVVTKAALKNLSYENVDGQQKVIIADDDLRRYVPVLAVVDELPNIEEFACTPMLYNWLTKSYTETACIDELGEANMIYLVSQIADVAVLENMLKQHLPTYKIASIKQVDFNLNDATAHFRYQLIFNDFYSYKERLSIFEKLHSHLETNIINTFWLPDWQCKQDEVFYEVEHPSYLAFNFENLNKVREFKEFMLNEFNVEISMNQVEAKENFAIVSRLTLVISIILFIFGTTSIILFVHNLLRNHLEKVKSNLGTFKAFGLENQLLLKNYRNIVLTFLIIAITGALIATGLLVGIEELLNPNSFLNLWNGWVLTAILVLFGISYFICGRTIKKILLHTPGDLIYDRV